MYAIGGRKRRAPMYNQQRSALSRKDWRMDESKPWGSVGAWFIGPKGENGDVFRELILKAVDHQLQFREKYYPSDPAYVDEEIRQSESYQRVMKKTECELAKMLSEMDKSIPFFSTRYKGHVTWDTVLSANVGYIVGLLYNQNNAAQEASSVTTPYEIEVGQELCEMLGYDKSKSRGHLTAGGTIANIEAMWAARNVKFMPLAFKTALQEESLLSAAKDQYQIYLPQLHQTVKYVDATDWQLLNLDTDAILNIPDEVLAILNQSKRRSESQVTYEELMTLMKSYTLESIGPFTFYKKYNIKNAPCVFVPQTAHISLFKGANITGLGSGSKNVILVPVDKNSRLSMTALRSHLENSLERRTPVVAVVAVMGTTEESAIDPLSDILALRDEFLLKGLNFIVHADGAWGGYFCSMLREPAREFDREVLETSGFVPELNMSEYVQKQLIGLARCDTITIDPHKSGFCPYPAGAICYRDERMNNALAVTVQVSYYYGSVNLGDWGLEGSKPGAAAAGVMFANRIIGLHKNGYGRILSECMFTAKMLYCLWCTLPEEGDNFVLQPTIPLESTLVEDPIAFIRNYILDKTNEEIAQDHKVMDFLKEVGPDTLIPCFSVNVKGNTDVKKCNAVNNSIMKMLAHASESVMARRRPMLVTASTMSYHEGPGELPNENLHDFKLRLGLEVGGADEKTGVRYVITTCMDPWATSVEFMDDFARIMRNTILCAIGTVEEEGPANLRDYHEFVTTAEVDEDLKIIVYYAGRADPISHQYNVVAKFQFAYRDDAINFMKGSSGSNPLVIKTKEKMSLHELLIKEFEEGQTGLEFFVDCYQGMPDTENMFLSNIKLKVVDLARYDHFDYTATHAPAVSTFFLYGDKKNAYITHIPNKNLDFLQLAQLGGIPEQVDQVILSTGVEMTLTERDVTGGETEVSYLVQEGKEYQATFDGVNGVETTTAVKIFKVIFEEANVYGNEI